MMNKQTMCAVLACMAGGAWAQSASSVEVYGVVDLAISNYRGAGAGSKTMMTSSGITASRIGFRGKEDLGGGMTAGFDLEAGLNVDEGAGLSTNISNQPDGARGAGGLTFNRKSYMYLSGKAGELRLGRDYTPSFWNTFVYDPYRVGVGIGLLTMHGTTSTGIRASNSIGYYTPGCSSFQCKGPFMQLMYAMGENGGDAANRNDGNYWGVRAGYGASNWDVAVATGVTKNVAAGNYRQSNIGAGYTWQGQRFMFLVGENKTGKPVTALGGGSRVRYAQVGGWFKINPAGAAYFPVSYTRVKRNDAQSSTANKYSVGYVHPLSKRTAVYANYAYIDNGGLMNFSASSSAVAGPIPRAGGSASGVDVGIRHSF